MSKGLFITGTGTDTGKTYVTALIVKKLRETGVRAAYYKAAVSGNERDHTGKLIPGDAEYVARISGIEQRTDSMCPYVYERAYSPHLAARLEGNPVDMERVEAGYRALTGQYDFITMEGSGGILCPTRYPRPGRHGRADSCTDTSCPEKHDSGEIKKAQGVYLYTEDQKLIDSVSSWWCMIHGYCHPELNEAMKAQIDRFSHVMLGGLTHEPAKKLSEKLAEWLPGDLDYCFFPIRGVWRWKWR